MVTVRAINLAQARMLKGISQPLFLCAWCVPLNKLLGTHGICPKHKAEFLGGLNHGVE